MNYFDTHEDSYIYWFNLNKLDNYYSINILVTTNWTVTTIIHTLHTIIVINLANTIIIG
jgi:hypothetical protein